jgi:hypothetical protein
VRRWVDELPLAGPWPAMGVRTDTAPWPVPAPAELLAHRRAVLAAHPDAVQVQPGSEALVEEAVSLVPGAIDLAAAAVAQADDLCMLAADDGWPLVAGALLYPSHWRLSEKVGCSLAQVHDRVPGYPAEQVDRFLSRLRPGQVVWRRNLLFHRDGELHAPWPSAADTPVDQWWLRSERQTLRVLPSTGGILFTIRTRTAPLAELRAVDRVSLALRVAELPDSWAAYAGVAGRREELVTWLTTS